MELPEESIDVVVTSPPYNIGLDYNTYADSLDPDFYLDWTDMWATCVKRILKESGSFFLNVGGKPTDSTKAFDIFNVMNRRWHLQNTIHWIKSISIGDTTHGHFKPINSPRYVNDCHEFIFHFTKTGKVPLDRKADGLAVSYQDKANIKRFSGDPVRCRGNTWFIPYKTVHSKKRHPATFPPDLPKNCIRLHGVKPGMRVLDPFCGVGNTGIACRDLGVNFIGYEIDPKYYQISKNTLLLENIGATKD